MKTRLQIMWAFLWLHGTAAVDRFRPLPRTGLVTEADADAFVAELHRTEEDAATPIFAALLREYPELELTYAEIDDDLAAVAT